PGGLFAGLDPVLLPAELGTRHEGEGAQPAPATERPHDVEVADRLGEGQAPRIEGRGAGGPHRGVVRVVDEEMEGVAARGEAEVDVPRVDAPPQDRKSTRLNSSHGSI